MFVRIARLQEVETGDRAARVEGKQKIVRAGVTDDIVRLRRGREQATDSFAARIRHKMQTAFRIPKLNPVGLGKELPRYSQRDGSAPMRFLPARLLMKENNDKDENTSPVQA